MGNREDGPTIRRSRGREPKGAHTKTCPGGEVWNYSTRLGEQWENRVTNRGSRGYF